MIDSLGDLVEPLLRIAGRIVGAVFQAAFELLCDALLELFGCAFDGYYYSMRDSGWWHIVAVPLSLILAVATFVTPVATVGFAAFLLFQI